MGMDIGKKAHKNFILPNRCDELEPEYQIKYAMLKGRKQKKITQKGLSEITGITQSDISKLENGTANPSLKTLEKIAEGLGLRLKVEFVEQ